MEIKLNDKVIIVTGGGRGIGREIVTTLAAEGATLVTTDISEEALETLGAELDAAGVSHREFPCDVTDAAQISSVVEKVLAEFGRIDVLVKNAGIAAHAPIASMREAMMVSLYDLKYY